MMDFVVSIKTSEKQLQDIKDWLKSLNLESRVIARMKDGTFKDITDDPKYKDIVEEFKRKMETNL